MDMAELEIGEDLMSGDENISDDVLSPHRGHRTNV